MKKKIFTFLLTITTICLSLYFIWLRAANFQEDLVKNNINNDLALKITNEQIRTKGFPFKLITTISDFESSVKSTSLVFKFLELEIIRLIYNFTDTIFFIEKPTLKNVFNAGIYSSSNRIKISLSDKPFSGQFKLIAELEGWKLFDNKNLRQIGANKMIFAMKDSDGKKLDFYFQAEDFDSPELNKIMGKESQQRNTLNLKGFILDKSSDKQKIKLSTLTISSIQIRQIDLNIGSINLNCNDAVDIKLSDFTNEQQFDCLLNLTQEHIAKTDIENVSVQKFINLIRLILIIKNPIQTGQPEGIPLNFRFSKGSLFVNGILIYKFSI